LILNELERLPIAGCQLLDNVGNAIASEERAISNWHLAFS